MKCKSQTLDCYLQSEFYCKNVVNKHKQTLSTIYKHVLFVSNFIDFTVHSTLCLLVNLGFCLNWSLNEGSVCLFPTFHMHVPVLAKNAAFILFLHELGVDSKNQPMLHTFSTYPHSPHCKNACCYLTYHGGLS